MNFNDMFVGFLVPKTIESSMNKKVLDVFLPVLTIGVFNFIFSKYKIDITDYLLDINFDYSYYKFWLCAFMGMGLSTTWAWERKLLASKFMFISVLTWFAFAISGNFIVLEGRLFLAYFVVVVSILGFYANYSDSVAKKAGKPTS